MFRIAVIMNRDAQLENSGLSFLSSVYLSVSSRLVSSRCCTYSESSDNIHFSVCFFSLYLYILVPVLTMMLSTYTGVLLMPDACTFDRLCCVI